MAHIHNVLDTNLHFIIDPLTRQLRIDTEVEKESKMVVIQYDHNSERVTFEIPKEVDGHDMSLCNVVQVHYLNVSTDGRTTASGVYEVEDLKPSGDVVVGTWLISQNATQLAGTLNFLIRFVCTTDGNLDYVWNTAVYQSIAVSSGLYYGEEVVVEYADILEQWRKKLVDSGGVSDDRIKTAVSEYMAENPVTSEGDGLTTDEKNVILTLFKNGVYSADMRENIARLETLWSGNGDDSGDSGDSGDNDSGGNSDETVTTYSVTNNLTNVTSDNSATSVNAGGSYTATLIVADGCILENLSIVHNGVDVTADVYGEGYILITNVTGDIVITAVAAKPEYVDMVTGGKVESASMYSDNGSTVLKNLNYQTGWAYALRRTESEADVTITLTNNTDADISGTTYVGELTEYPVKLNSIKVYNAKIGTSAALGVGKTTQFTYTLSAGKYLCVYAPQGIDISVIGTLSMVEPIAEIETTTKYADTWTMYSDNGTTQLATRNYQTSTYTTETFNEDTVIKISIPGAVTIPKSYWGCCDPSAPNTVHYAVQKFNDNSVVADEAIAVYEYTVKAGYAFVMTGFSGTIYIGRA